MATQRRQEPEGRTERQRARLLQRRESWETGAETTGTAPENAERRCTAKVFLCQDVGDAGANEGRKGTTNPQSVVA